MVETPSQSIRTMLKAAQISEHCSMSAMSAVILTLVLRANVWARWRWWPSSNRQASTKKPGHMTDEEWERYSDERLKKYYLDGLRSTQHLEDVIKMLSADERKEAVRVFSNIEYGPYEGTKTKRLRDRDILRTLKSTSGENV